MFYCTYLDIPPQQTRIWGQRGLLFLWHPHSTCKLSSESLHWLQRFPVVQLHYTWCCKQSFTVLTLNLHSSSFQALFVISSGWRHSVPMPVVSLRGGLEETQLLRHSRNPNISAVTMQLCCSGLQSIAVPGYWIMLASLVLISLIMCHRYLLRSSMRQLLTKPELASSAA